MEIERSETLEATLSQAAKSNVFVLRSSDQVDIDFTDVNAKTGVRHGFELKLPLSKTRALLKQLNEAIEGFDEYVAKRKEEERLASLVTEETEE